MLTVTGVGARGGGAGAFKVLVPGVQVVLQCHMGPFIEGMAARGIACVCARSSNCACAWAKAKPRALRPCSTAAGTHAAAQAAAAREACSHVVMCPVPHAALL